VSDVVELRSLEGSLCLDAGVDPALAPYIAYIRQQVRPFAGEYHADWLLSDWSASTWQTRTKWLRQVNGEWRGTLDVCWDLLLPDGCRLTEPKYAALLDVCRRMSFLFRLGMAGDMPALNSWRDFNAFLFHLCEWLVLESARYHPARHSFSLLDNDGIRRLFLALGRGGWCEALNIVERCLNEVHEAVFGRSCPSKLLAAPGNWPKEVRDDVVGWLAANNGYSGIKNSKNGSGLVSRAWLGRRINTTSPKLNFPHLNAVLRQFEPRWQHPNLLLPGYSSTEYPRHRTPLLQEVLRGAGSEGTVNSAHVHMANLLKLSRHLPEVMPDPSGFRLKDAQRAANRLTKPSGHTPFIPVDIGLRYLNEALRWVVHYGDALVDYYLTIYAKRDAERRSAGNLNNIGVAEKTIFRSTPLPDALHVAGFEFTRFTSNTDRSFENRRATPTLYEALEIWLGAVTVLLGFMKPSRDTEVTALPRVCLLRTRGGHYWLDSDLAKRTKAEVRARTGGKPIPVIAARAIQQVRKLNRGLVKVYKEKDPHLRESLFYLPNSTKWGGGKKVGSKVLNDYLDKFCDYVNFAPDDYGRRWYLRIHEMRKWFLLLLFWSGRYDVLDAARWIAGHTDVEHIYAYIEREFPGDKIGELESECAIDLLAKYDETQVIMDDEEVGLAELYHRVLRHFNVRRLNLVKERDWHGLVQELFEKDYHLEPVTVQTYHDQKRVCIAIRQGSRGDD